MTMAFLKARREEVELVREAADRIAHRTHSKFVLNQDRLEIVDKDLHENEPQAPRSNSVKFG
jgi:hypothetical protein